MHDTSLLRIDDLRFLLDLVGELHELPDQDREGRRNHLTRRLRDYFDAYMAVYVETKHEEPEPPIIERFTESSYHSKAEQDFIRAYFESQCATDPIVVRSFSQPDSRLAIKRDQLISDGEWLMTPVYNECYKPLGVRDHLHTRVVVGNTPRKVGFGVNRVDNRAFTLREVQLIGVLNAYLPQLDPLLNDITPSVLPARFQRVIERLIAGDSVKQAAKTLKLSPHTVNDYIKSIYGIYEVNSRSQLLVKLLSGEPTEIEQNGHAQQNSAEDNGSSAESCRDKPEIRGSTNGRGSVPNDPDSPPNSEPSNSESSK